MPIFKDAVALQLPDSISNAAWVEGRLRQCASRGAALTLRSTRLDGTGGAGWWGCRPRPWLWPSSGSISPNHPDRCERACNAARRPYGRHTAHRSAVHLLRNMRMAAASRPRDSMLSSCCRTASGSRSVRLPVELTYIDYTSSIWDREAG